MVAIQLRSVTKVFPNGVQAVDHVDLDVAPGEFLVLLGPTGCGKSTLLRLIAGFEPPTSGEVRYDGVPVHDIEPADRHLAMVFQDYALYPHLTVAQNIGFPLRTGLEPVEDAAAVIAAAAHNLRITDLLHRRPLHLSGGEQQRVAVARALVRRPEILLLDEPMSNVDAQARAELRHEITTLARRLELTTIYVTHDQSEALTVADQLAVLRRGAIEQAGPPGEVYADPHTVFVAGFLGTPRATLLAGAIYADDARTVLDLCGPVIELPAELASRHTERVTVGVRALRAGPGLPGIVRSVQNLGHELLVRADIGAVPTPLETTRQELPDRPAQATGSSPDADVHVRVPFPASYRPGDRIEVAITPADLFLFDRTGLRIPFASHG